MKWTVVLCAAAVAGLSMLSAPQPAEARLQYLKAFVTKYETVKEEATEKKCLVCHSKASKKERSDYAKAVEKALDDKNVKDEKKIEEAFAKVEKEKVSKDAEMTYGDLLKKGKLPEPFKAEK